MTNLSDHYSALLSKYTPGGSQTLSKMANRYPSNYPKVLSWGKDGHVWDVEGREYIDLIAGLGAISVGYADERVNRAVACQLQKGVSFSLPTVLEYETAKCLTDLIPGTAQWKFGKNGTDGTVMAVRAARAYTGRTKIMTVGYNGCQEMFECQGVRNAGIPTILKEHNTRAVYNDLGSFKDLSQYACVLLEPMVYEYPKADFLEDLRIACDDTKTLLIFDEVVNGGRFEGFTSSAYFKVQPDLLVLSKGIANGFPLCAVGGSLRYMQTFGRDDFFASGTFGGEAVSLAAFLETQRILTSSISRMVTAGQSIQMTFNQVFKGLATAEGYPTRLVFKFPTDIHKYAFWQEMCKRGVLVGYTNFVMASHSVQDVRAIRLAIEDSATILKANWQTPELVLQGPIPTSALRK